jgi:hypothetical protein
MQMKMRIVRLRCVHKPNHKPLGQVVNGGLPFRADWQKMGVKVSSARSVIYRVGTSFNGDLAQCYQ